MYILPEKDEDLTEIVKKHFQDEAAEFDKIIHCLVPFYNNMIGSIAYAIPFNNSMHIKVADLGCGTGNVSKNIKERFPNAKIVCIDLAEKMIEMAEIKLSEYGNITYHVGDFRDFKFDEDFDAVVSSLALHHLTNENKKRFYLQIYHALRPGGVFYNADSVLGASDRLNDIYMEKWKEYMNRNISMGKIESKWLPKHEEEDIPAKLVDQVDWLRDIGFRDVDVIWKYYNFAVYGGLK